MNCPHCHRVLRDHALVCYSCGTTVVPTVGVAATPATSPQTGSTLIGQLLDDKYQVIGLLGKGGMGAVYRARRVHIGDEVAIKVLHREYVNDEKTVERFRREAQAAAMLRDPSIVTIHDFSEGNNNVPAYIVMELVEGNSLRKIIETNGALTQNRAVSLIREICKGVGAAHRLEVVHRDIKPDNIIVLSPDIEDRERVKIVDFGIAKLREAVAGKTLTQTGKVIGTLYYMSPEQCYGEDVDARSDVYALGVMFYEMLTGTPPFTSESATGIVAKHLTEPPPPLPFDLGVAPAVETVLRKALSKDAESRQSDARQLGRELAVASGVIQEHDAVAYSQKTIDSIQATDTVLIPADEQLEKSPTESAPQSLTTSHRRRRLVIGGAVALIIIVAGILIARRTGGSKSSPVPVPVARAPIESWQLTKTLTHKSKIYGLAFSPDDRLLATVSSEPVVAGQPTNSEVRLWDTQTGDLTRTLPETSGGALSVAFSPDGHSLATATGSLNAAQRVGAVELWDAKGGGLRWVKLAHTDYATSVAFSPDGGMIASGSRDHEVKLWAARDGALLRTLHCDGPVFAVVFSPDGKVLASTSQQSVELWDAVTGTSIRKLSSDATAVDAAAFSHDGQLAASAGVAVNIWNAQTGALKQTLHGHNDIIDSLSFSPDGKVIASASYDTTVVLWDTVTGAIQKTLNHSDKVTAVAFSHDGRMLATGGWDKAVRLWQ